MRAPMLPLSDEKRKHQRVRLHLLGRFMLADGQEYPCQVVNMSPGGAALVTPIPGKTGERIIAYIDEVGRVEGKIARTFEGGFAIQISATPRKRDKLASLLTWLANRSALGMPEDRRHDRLQPRNPFSHVKLPDGRTYTCRVVDMSISGAAVAIEVKPAIGTEVTIGVMRARIIRHFAEGIAVQFADVQDERSLVERLTGGDDSVAISA